MLYFTILKGLQKKATAFVECKPQQMPEPSTRTLELMAVCRATQRATLAVRARPLEQACPAGGEGKLCREYGTLGQAHSPTRCPKSLPSFGGSGAYGVQTAKLGVNQSVRVSL